MEVFEKLGIKIPNAVLIKGATDTEKDDEIIDFLKQYGPINRLVAVNEPSSEFDHNLIIEYNSGAAVAALAPLLPYTQTLENHTYEVVSLASLYAENIGHEKTQVYLTELKQLAKVSGTNFAEVLKNMMSQISDVVADEQSATEEEGGEGRQAGRTASQPSFKESPGHVEKLPKAKEATVRAKQTIPACDLNPPEVQRYVVEHIMKSEEAPTHMLPSPRLRVFSGKIPRPPHESDYDTWRSNVDLIMKDPAISDLQRSRKILDSLLPPAADMVKHLSSDTLPNGYLQQLDSAFGTVQDGDELYAKFMDTFQDAGEKPSAFLQRLQVALNLAVKRGGVSVIDINRHLLNQFCRGCWDNSLISDLQLKQKKADPPSFAELLLLLRTEEDREAAKTLRMKQHLGAKQRVSAQAHSQVAYGGEEQSLCAALTTLTQQLSKQMAEIQHQLASLTANSPHSSCSSKSYRPALERSAGERTPSQPKPGYCFRCGEDGHIKPQCDNEPNPALVAEKRRKFNAKNPLGQKRTPPAAALPKGLVGSRCTAAVSIAGIDCSCLLDTGSQVTTVPVSFYNKNLVDHPIQPLDTLLEVEGAAGQSVPYLGYVEVTVTFPKDFLGVITEVSTLALVVPDVHPETPSLVLIGTNTLDVLYVQHLGSEVVNHQPQEYGYRAVLKTLESRHLQHQNGHVGVVRMLGRSPTLIPAGHSVILEGLAQVPPHAADRWAIVEHPTQSLNLSPRLNLPLSLWRKWISLTHLGGITYLDLWKPTWILWNCWMTYLDLWKPMWILMNCRDLKRKIKLMTTYLKETHLLKQQILSVLWLKNRPKLLLILRLTQLKLPLHLDALKDPENVHIDYSMLGSSPADDECTVPLLAGQQKLQVMFAEIYNPNRRRGCSSVVERMLCMYEAPGSIPGISKTFFVVQR
ncbi:Zinc finger CCHC domain-containing protein 12 [Merluccius polli]|uniref:Zinc finger CCHC domain-containing protein 12 n=1 Tax=Merluccius polli TaxID=89951 RepID=A0AA47N3J1_MERPO|nr:Zinc finger CCHC domain-containing protein 12 [Merluccius polli]